MTEGGIEVAVRAQPKARRAKVGGAATDGALRVAVTTAPEDGRATEAVAAALAEAFGVSKRAVELRHGATSRHKLFRIAGETARLEQRLRELLA
jgi:uncharacterized protein YggU (UPF0235/DUF167 family)